MLTFCFTGVNGEMTEAETLTAGMTGKQVKFAFSSDWEGLRKVVVYRAGEVCCTTVDVQETDTIPAAVLAGSLRRLFVGVYGISEDGSAVTPTIYAVGPFIHIGAEEGGDPGYDPEEPFWLRLEAAVAEAVRCTSQSLTEEQKAQARENIGVSGAGLDETTAKLLLTVLKSGSYAVDQSENIRQLQTALCGTVYHTVTLALAHVSGDNASASVEDGGAYSVTLCPEDGYSLETVTVTMGGVDVTEQTYDGGTVTIPAVTGDVVIAASAALGLDGVIYIPASLSDAGFNRYEYPSSRMSAAMLSGETPFPQNGDQGLGDLYLIPVPAGASVLNVTCAGLIAGPQFFTLSDGTYTRKLDAGWQTADSLCYAFTVDAYDYVGVNFKNSANVAFMTEGYDTSGLRIWFGAAES